MSAHRKGGCLCGAVRYEISGPVSPVGTCHCSQCARWTGHVFASFTVQNADLEISGKGHVSWYASSEEARRGFCNICGSSLFWERVGSDETDILAGSLDKPTGLTIERHIYVDDKSDYYEICDGKPQFPQYGKVRDEGE